MTTQPQAIVVGVGSEQGVGAALARRFAREGLGVIVSGRTLDRLEKVVAAIIESGGQATPFVADATVEKDVVALFDYAAKSADARLDLVVFNAGNNVRQDLRTMPADLFESTWRVGTFGGFLVGREAARRLSAAGARNRHFHRRYSKFTRETTLHGVRFGEGWIALISSVNGARVRSSRRSCRACRHRWRH